METYNNTKNAIYDVFSANMTMDTDVEIYHRSELSACKSCQCNCRLCLGGNAPEGTDVFLKTDAESILEKLLDA